MGELYGEMNELTQEWTDGLASSLIRNAANDESKDLKWTVFDGPVDALWIESMNTVLDDNMTLCLANGERIKLKPSMRMLFEVQDLAVASPATVSRCGMVYIHPAELGWKPYMTRWLTGLNDDLFNADMKTKIKSLFTEYVDAGFAFLRRSGTLPITAVDTQIVAALCDMFEAVFNHEAATANGCVSADALNGEEVNKAADMRGKPVEVLEKLIYAVFCFAFVWAFGGPCDTRSKQAFETWAERTFQDLSLPRDGGVFDGFIDLKTGISKMRRWVELVTTFKYSEDQSYLQMLVPNLDTIRFSYLLDKMLSARKSVFLTGMTGVGKSVIINNLLGRMAEVANVYPVKFTFSAQSEASVIQMTLEGKLEKKRKSLIGAPAGKQVVLLVDDVNMPAVEQYGAQPPVELLRQIQDSRGVYDRRKLFWKEIENTTMLLSAAPPGGGRSR